MTRRIVPGRWILACALVLTQAGCALPRWPVEGPVSSGWGLRWRGWLPEIHEGIDIALPEGTPVRTMAPGTVRFAGPMPGYGLMVSIDHGGDVTTLYGHLADIQVSLGDRVSSRQVIALSGSTGDVSGPHLHFEIRRWGRSEDPVPLLGGLPRSGR